MNCSREGIIISRLILFVALCLVICVLIPACAGRSGNGVALGSAGNTNDPQKEGDVETIEKAGPLDSDLEKLLTELADVNQRLARLEAAEHEYWAWHNEYDKRIALGEENELGPVLEWFRQEYERIDQNKLTISNNIASILRRLRMIWELDPSDVKGEIGPHRALFGDLKSCIADIEESASLIKWAQSNIDQVEDRLSYYPKITPDMLSPSRFDIKTLETFISWGSTLGDTKIALMDRQFDLKQQIETLSEKGAKVRKDEETEEPNWNLLYDRRRLKEAESRLNVVTLELATLENAKTNVARWVNEREAVKSPDGWKNMAIWYRQLEKTLADADAVREKRDAQILDTLKSMIEESGKVWIQVCEDLLKDLKAGTDETSESAKTSLFKQLEYLKKEYGKMEELMLANENEPDVIKQARMEYVSYPSLCGLFSKEGKITQDQDRQVTDEIGDWKPRYVQRQDELVREQKSLQKEVDGLRKNVEMWESHERELRENAEKTKAEAEKKLLEESKAPGGKPEEKPAADEKGQDNAESPPAAP
jgi:hypothetical protein